MSIMTDEMIEKAARAMIARELGSDHFWAEDGRELWKDRWRETAKTAIIAILPDIVEACAREADETISAFRAARRIRSLLEKP